MIFLTIFGTVSAQTMFWARGIASVLCQARHISRQGKRVWCVTDLDGVLVKVPSLELVEGKRTRTLFRELCNNVERVVGLTSNDPAQAERISGALVRKELDFYNPENLSQQRISLNGTSSTILYNGIIYTFGTKGKALIEYLKFTAALGDHAPEAVIFADDRQVHVANVMAEMFKTFPNIEAVGLHYDLGRDE